MRVLVTGGRDFADEALLTATLDELRQEYDLTTLIHGAARGADSLAGEWATFRGVEVIACPADWAKHGRAAGSIRNRQMLEHKPDMVVAFPGGKGTANMISIAKKTGIQVIEVRNNEKRS